MKSRLARLPEAFPDAIVIVDSGGRIIQANAQAAALFGFGDRELNGLPVQALFPHQRLMGPGGRPARRDRAARHLELVGSRRDSSLFPAIVALVSAQIDHRTAVVMSIRDLTEAQRTQFMLRRGLQMLASEGWDCRALLRQLIQGQEDDRARIAGDIHDDVIQTMSAASLRLQRLRLRLTDDATLQILAELQEAITLSLGRLRQLIFDLRPPALEAGSLGAAVRGYLEQLHSDSGIVYQLTDLLSGRAPESTATLIYRNVRESLANVRQHARASHVAVELRDLEHGCLVRVIDDGVGYDPADVEDRPGHLGLLLIRERAELAGGWCRIESSPGDGTTVEFWVPLGETSTEPDTGHERAG